MTSSAVQSREATLLVNGMDCASCVAHVEKAAGKVEGVREVSVSLARGRAKVLFDPGRTDPQQIARVISDSGYPSEIETEASNSAAAEERRVRQQNEIARRWLNRAIVGIILWLPLEATHWLGVLFGWHVTHDSGHVNWMTWLSLVTGTIAITYVGGEFFKSAWGALKNRTSNMDTLISLGAGVAYLYSLGALVGHLTRGWPLPHLYFVEGSALLALISLGHWLEARARQSAGSAIRDLMNLAPTTAFRLTGLSETEQVPVQELHPGDRVLVRPGDRVPIDGVVIAGRSSVDESMITGEPLPAVRQPGDAVIGGTLNTDGSLRIRVTAVGRETALAQIIQLVENAQSTKPAVQRLADRISAIFVPAVLVVAMVTGIGWYAYGTWQGWESATTWGWLAKSVCSVLIIACPCALGLAVPAALMVGTGRGARLGILIRDIDALQNAEKIDTVALDKTGTLTQGKPVVDDVVSFNGVPGDEILRLAAISEKFSEHPLAKAIVAEAGKRGGALADPDSFDNEAGYGVTAKVDGKLVLVGSDALMLKHGASALARAQEARVGTTVHVAQKLPQGVERLGMIHLSDAIKEDSARAVAELHAMNLRVLLLTGDNESAARAIAAQVGIDDVRAGVKPSEKAQAVAELKEKRGRRVAMVGDGINDAPALAKANLGIAIGSGSDIAKETGDIVLVGSSLAGVATSIRLSRATMRKIRQNLFFAFAYNVIAIPLAAFGMLSPAIAAGAMALSDVSVIGNALLLRRTRLR